jgi:hypothetical protein
VVDGEDGKASSLVLHDKGCIKGVPQHRREDEGGCRHGCSPKRGRGGGVTLTSGGSDDEDGGPMVPRATRRYGGAP